MNDFQPQTSRIQPLPVYLRHLNKMLGWKPYQMAEWMKKDAAEISRWLSLTKLHKLQDATLEYIARRYQDAGLHQVTVEVLQRCRDFGGQPTQENAFNVPEQWLWLIDSVLSFDSDIQQMYFRRWSQDIEDGARLIHRGRREDPGVD